MERNNRIVVAIAIVLILICLICAIKNKNESIDSETNVKESEISVDYREITNEVTGETYYQVYNDKTGEVIANVAEEHQVDLYIDNPDYIEAEIADDVIGEDAEVLE